MTPKQLEKLINSKAVWGKYADLLNISDARLRKKLLPIFNAMLSDPAYQMGGPMLNSYKTRAWAAIQREKAFLAKNMNNPTGDILEAMYESNRSWLLGQPELSGASMGAIDSRVGVQIANLDVDVGKRIKQMMSNDSIKKTKLFAKISDGLKAADVAIRAGELEGAAIGPIITDIRQNVIGLDPHQRVKGVTAQIKTVVRTQSARLNYDIRRDFARSQPNVIGLRIQRGPGECHTNICGIVLGVGLGEIGTYLFGKNDPPYLPIHPNCYCTPVGYVYATDEGYEEEVARWERDMKNPNKAGDYAQYQAFSQSHKGNYGALAAFQKQLSAERAAA